MDWDWGDDFADGTNVDRDPADCDITIGEVIDKIALGLPRDHAVRIVDECMRAAQLADIGTPERLQRFADELIRRGGFAKMVGGGLKMSVAVSSAD